MFYLFSYPICFFIRVCFTSFTNFPLLSTAFIVWHSSPIVFCFVNSWNVRSIRHRMSDGRWKTLEIPVEITRNMLICHRSSLKQPHSKVQSLLGPAGWERPSGVTNESRCRTNRLRIRRRSASAWERATIYVLSRIRIAWTRQPSRRWTAATISHVFISYSTPGPFLPNILGRSVDGWKSRLWSLETLVVSSGTHNPGTLHSGLLPFPSLFSFPVWSSVWNYLLVLTHPCVLMTWLSIGTVYTRLFSLFALLSFWHSRYLHKLLLHICSHTSVKNWSLSKRTLTNSQFSFREGTWEQYNWLVFHVRPTLLQSAFPLAPGPKVIGIDLVTSPMTAQSNVCHSNITHSPCFLFSFFHLLNHLLNLKICRLSFRYLNNSNDKSLGELGRYRISNGPLPSVFWPSSDVFWREETRRRDHESKHAAISIMSSGGEGESVNSTGSRFEVCFSRLHSSRNPPGYIKFCFCFWF